HDARVHQFADELDTEETRHLRLGLPESHVRPIVVQSSQRERPIASWRQAVPEAVATRVITAIPAGCCREDEPHPPRLHIWYGRRSPCGSTIRRMTRAW